MSKVFISGSIAIKKLSLDVEQILNNIIHQGFEILVGDARGIDTLIQNYCLQKNYYNVTVYSIIEKPRYKVEGFKGRCIPVSPFIKKERERQQEKDKAMTQDSDYSFVIWDGKSQGSYNNALRAIEQQKKIKVYLEIENRFLYPESIKSEIKNIFEKSNISKTKAKRSILLDEDVAEEFKTPEEVNQASRSLLQVKPAQIELFS